jgi:hypothetical protein
MTCKALVFFPVCSEFIALQAHYMLSSLIPEEKLHLCTLSDYWIFSTLPPSRCRVSILQFILEGVYHTHMYYNSEGCRHVLSIALTTHFCNTLCKFSNSISFICCFSYSFICSYAHKMFRHCGTE